MHAAEQRRPPGKQLMVMEGPRIGLVLVAYDDEGLPPVMAVLAVKLIEEFAERALDGLLFIALGGIDLSPRFPLLRSHAACPAEARMGRTERVAGTSGYRHRVIIGMILT